MAGGAERLFLKIDSTVRGSVAGQIDGALRAWSQQHPEAWAVICPAFPAQRRTVVSGQVLVDGVPVAESAAATDPVTPRTVSDLTVIVPGAVRRDASELSGRARAKLVIDATDEVDLDRLAHCPVCGGRGPGHGRLGRTRRRPRSGLEPTGRTHDAPGGSTAGC